MAEDTPDTHVRSLVSADQSSIELCPKCGHALNPNLHACPMCSHIPVSAAPIESRRGLSTGLAVGIIISCFVLAISYLIFFGGLLKFFHTWSNMYHF